MTTKHYDIVIVGGGPAGSTAARIAAEKGAKTLFIEKRQEIGTPVRCGEGMPKAFLDLIGIAPEEEWISAHIKGARLISPSGHTMYIDEKTAGSKTGYNIERDLFDKSLARQAVEAGADLMVKTSALGLIKDNGSVKGVVAKQLGETFRVEAPITIGADGFESMVGRWAGIDTRLKPRDVTSCLQYRMNNVECLPDYNDFYPGSVSPGGYLWVFPKGENEANVGLGVSLAKIRKVGGAETKMYLDKFIAAHPEYSKGQVIEMVAGGVSVCAPLEKTVVDGLMLVGDAARLIDPMNGGGVAPACVSGKYAGEVGAAAVADSDISSNYLQRYEKAWRADFEDIFYRNYIAKEKLVSLSDELLDMIVESIKDEKLEDMSVLEVIRAVERHHPEIVEDLAALI